MKSNTHIAGWIMMLLGLIDDEPESIYNKNVSDNDDESDVGGDDNDIEWIDR